MSRSTCRSAFLRLVAVAVVVAGPPVESAGQLFRDWLGGRKQQPLGRETIDPAPLVQSQAGSAIKYQFPSGWHLLLGQGFELAPSLPPDSALLYQDNRCVMVLEGGMRKPRTLYRARLKESKGNVPTWSTDGRYCFHFFDCHLQLVMIETSTGQMRSLTNYQVHRNYKGGTHFEPIVFGPFLYDPKDHRLVYIEQDYGPPWDAEIVAVLLRTGERKVVSQRIELSNYLGGRQISLDHGRVYTHAKYAQSVDVWTLSGETVGQIELPNGGPITGFSLSPDETAILIQPVAQVYDLASKSLLHKLPEGHGHGWSPDAKSVSFLRRAEEVWVYGLESKKAEMLAKILPREDAPDWSRHRSYHPPVWSADGQMLTVGLSSYAGADSAAHLDKLTLLFDLKAKRVVALPWRVYGVSWSPIPRPFPQGFHEESGAKP